MSHIHNFSNSSTTNVVSDDKGRVVKEDDTRAGLRGRHDEASGGGQLACTDADSRDPTVFDHNTILYTTLVQLAKHIFLKNCSVWMHDGELEE